MNWSITQIKVSNISQGEAIVVASFSISDGTTTMGSEARLKDVDASNLVPLNQVTEEQCVAWVKGALGPEQVAIYEAKVSEVTNAPDPQVVPLPWENN
jgi:hypothetical protein